MSKVVLIVLLILAVAVVAALIGRSYLRRAAARMFLAAITPKVGFDHDAVPPPPDYFQPDSWAVTPNAPAKSLLTPSGVVPVDPANAEVDVFFVHPTMYFGTKNWNAPIDDPRANEGVDELVVPAQSTVFNGSGRIFAPRYRQATLYAFVKPGDNGRQALELAYGDVARAFQYFLDHHAGDRPFILASHSQGTCHSIRLLEQVIAPSRQLRDRLVVAYLIGYWLPLDKLSSTLATIPPCSAPDDTGCLVAWDSFGEGGGPDHDRDRAEHWYPTSDGTGEWQRRAGKPALCVNPLTGRRDTDPAPAELNLGAVHPVIKGLTSRANLFFGEQPIGMTASALAGPLSHHVSARCSDDGFLYISRPPAKAFRLAVLPGQSYHNYDYGLFYMNFRADVERRVAAFMARAWSSRDRGS
jgi:hypothetical protein